MVKQRGIQKKGLDLIFGNTPLSVQEDSEKMIKPQPEIVLYLKDGLNGADRNFTKYPNEIHNIMLDNLKEEAEGILYIYLWRESWGYGRNYCRTSHATVAKKTIIGSQKTAQRAMSRLLENHFVIKALLEDGQANVTNNGGLYRIITPQEIISGKTEEGIPLDDIPIDGAVMINLPSVSMVKMTMVNMTNPEDLDKDRTSRGVAKMTNGQNGYGQNDHGHIDQSGMDKMGMVNMTRPEANDVITSNEVRYSQNDHGQHDQHLKDRYLKDTLSLHNIVDLFYTKIGQSKISKEKRERAKKNLEELIEDGFSLQDIQFAVEWTLKNSKEKPYDFSIVKHTIGQAMAAKKDLEAKQARKAEEEREEIRRQEEEARNLEERERVIAYKEALSEDERVKLRERAEAEIRSSGQYKEEFITDLLVDAMENNIIKEQIGIKLSKQE